MNVAQYNPFQWQDFLLHKRFFMPRESLVSPKKKIFTIGSCFAQELRLVMIKKGYSVYPDYSSVSFDKNTQIFDKIPDVRDFIAHYDTFSILQEFEASFGIWKGRESGFWKVADRYANELLQQNLVFQDPYRKMCYATSKNLLAKMSDNITQRIREGIEQADLYIITLGLTEVWKHRSTSKYLCRPPDTGYGGGAGCADLHLSTFAENYVNLTQVIELIRTHYPHKKIVISVSPVSLDRTWRRDVDVYTANLESKSILRSVAGQVCREYSGVFYFPSYEMATVLGLDMFEEDGRHVKPEFAELIVTNFLSIFS
ncbi:MAG: hypothetical protein CMJ75_07600 [Planctomycetaceae bacterium]|nr:hypothetical protein [Planctomycetaceae bacterium]